MGEMDASKIIGATMKDAIESCMDAGMSEAELVGIMQLISVVTRSSEDSMIHANAISFGVIMQIFVEKKLISKLEVGGYMTMFKNGVEAEG